MKLGENILKLRKESNLSQEELAEKLDVTRQTISNWELGETEPAPKQLKKISEIFNISIDSLLDNKIDKLNKVNNTKKLVSIIIKTLKIFGILILIFLIIDVISLILFNTLKKGPFESIIKESTINCTIDDNDYLITVGSDAYFNCSNCTKSIQNNIKNIIDYSNIDKTVKNIKKYFKSNNGYCE